MRLTLRTLLAWIDSVLLPAEQQALGEKVAASAAAPQLISRLREVVERSALAAPRPEGRGLAADANSVAEYLDNTLPSDRLEPFERICIESDMHLAEVADCHGALAEIARQPAVVPPLDPVARRRLLEAIRRRIQDPRADGEHEAAIANARSLRAALTAGAGPADEPVIWSASTSDTGLPAEGRRRAPLAAWLSALAALLLLASLGGLLVWSLQRGRGPRVLAASREPAAPQAAVAHAGPPPAAPAAAVIDPSARSEASPVANDDEPAAAGPPREEGPPADEDGDAGPPTGDAPPPLGGPPRETAVSPSPRVPHGDALAIAAPAVPPPALGPGGPAAAPPAAEKGPAAAAGIVSGDALVFHRDAGQPDAADQSVWKPLARDAPLALREQLLAPPYCRPELTVDGMVIRLEPSTLATLARDADGTPRLEVVFGRAVVRSDAPGPRLGITAGDLVGVVSEGLHEPVCVEVALERAAGTDPATTPTRVRATVATTRSGIVWRQSQADGAPAVQPLAGLAAEGPVEAGSGLVWDSLDPAGVAVQPRREPPAWLAPPFGAERRLQQGAAAALAATATVEPLEKGLRELARHPRAENRMAAAATLALLGDYGELVALLSADTADRQLQEGQWCRLFDWTVPLALARGVNAAAQFGKACEAHGPAGRGAELLALARGLDDESLAAGGDERLVATLEAPELVLRRLAIRELVAITDPSAVERIRYRADGPENARREGVVWWRAKLAGGGIRRAAAGPAP